MVADRRTKMNNGLPLGQQPADPKRVYSRDRILVKVQLWNWMRTRKATKRFVHKASVCELHGPGDKASRPAASEERAFNVCLALANFMLRSPGSNRASKVSA